MKDVGTLLSNKEDWLERKPIRDWVEKGARFLDNAFIRKKVLRF